MSKRHTIIGGSIPIPPIPSEIPFQENLVFYAPLNEGELFDYISGEVGVPGRDSYCVWDEQEQMMHLGFDTNLVNGDNRAMGLRFSSTAFQSNMLTCIANRGLTACMYYKDSPDFAGNNSSWHQQRPLSIEDVNDLHIHYDNGGPGLNCAIDAYHANRSYSGNTVPSSALVYRFVAMTYNPSTNYMVTYENGTQKRSGSFGLPVAMNTYISSLCIMGQYSDASNLASNYNCSKMSIYAKDVRVYNRVLSVSEIQQLKYY